MKKISVFVVAALFLATYSFADNKKDVDRVENAGKVMSEILSVPEDVPQDLLDKADCVIVLPSVVKAAFIVGGSYGRGVMTCRTGENFNGKWSAPSMIALEGGSVGFQLGGQATDFVILVMNPRGATAILSSKVKLGADASAAAGPVGRNAEASTDVALKAEFLTYSRAKGLFAGLDLSGTALYQNKGDMEDEYGNADFEAILHGSTPVPPNAARFVSTVARYFVVARDR